MRLPAGLGVRVVVGLSLVGFGGFLAASALGSHDAERPFAGNWNTSYPQEPSSGTISFRFVSDEEGKAAADASGVPFAKCSEPSDWYVGTFSRGGESGSHVSCSSDSATVLRMLLRFDSSGIPGLGSVSLSGQAAWSGNYFLYGNGPSGGATSFGDWSGAFAGHVDGDGGAAAPSTTTTPTAPETTTSEPPACRDPAGSAPGCAPPPTCNGEKATIVADENDPFGLPLIGTAGDDVIVGRAFDDVIAAGGGNDLVCGAGGNDQISGGGGRDTLDGGTGSDRLRGNAGLDVLLGRDGNDTLLGGVDRDLISPGPGQDRVEGGPSEVDMVSYSDSRRGVSIDLATGVAEAEGHDRIVGIEWVVGSRYADRLWGDSSSNLLKGNAGDDNLFGRDDNDQLMGEKGNDHLDGGAYNNILDGGPGIDECLNGTTRSHCETNR